MRVLLVLCAIAALIGASLAFKSEKLQRNTVHVTADNIFEGTFRTRVDHYRAQDGRTVDFVSSEIFFRNFIVLQGFSSPRHIMLIWTSSKKEDQCTFI